MSFVAALINLKRGAYVFVHSAHKLATRSAETIPAAGIYFILRACEKSRTLFASVEQMRAAENCQRKEEHSGPDAINTAGIHLNFCTVLRIRKFPRQENYSIWGNIF
jgi:hypothetical protein